MNNSVAVSTFTMSWFVFYVNAAFYIYIIHNIYNSIIY